MDKKILLFLDHTNSLAFPELYSKSIKSPNGYRVIPVESSFNPNNSNWTDNLFQEEIIKPIKRQIQVNKPNSVLILSDLEYVDKVSLDKKIKLLHEKISEPLSVIDFRRKKHKNQQSMPCNSSEIPKFHTKGTSSLEEDISNLLTYFSQRCKSQYEKIEEAFENSNNKLLEVIKILNEIARDFQKIKVTKITKINRNESLIYKFELDYDQKQYIIYFEPQNEVVIIDDTKVNLNNDNGYRELLDYFKSLI
jgi:hypothetical protein